jgi:hypothetical protein
VFVRSLTRSSGRLFDRCAGPHSDGTKGELLARKVLLKLCFPYNKLILKCIVTESLVKNRFIE